MYRRTPLIAVLPINRTEDNKFHSLTLTAGSQTSDVALRQTAVGDGFCVSENDHISLA